MKWQFWRQGDEKPRKAENLRTIFNTNWLTEYRGEIPCCPGITHTLICAEIAHKQQKALLDAGFRPIDGRIPTHSIFCTFTLLRDSGSPRCLFNLYLDLSAYSPAWQTWIAAQVTKGLKRSLLRLTIPNFAIRCKALDEFPWCKENAEMDEYWLMDALVYLRSTLRDVDGLKG